jgi:NTE family protein
LPNKDDQAREELVARILKSRGGKALLGLSDEEMSRFLTSAEVSANVGAAADEAVFEEARARTAQVCDLYVDAAGVTVLGTIGAITALDENGFGFRRVGGASSGAAVAALLAAGYTAAEVREILLTTDYAQLFSRRRLPLTRADDPLRSPLWAWIDDLLAVRGIGTFDDVGDRLKIVVAELGNRQPLQLPGATRGLPVASAVAASMIQPKTGPPYMLRPEGRDPFAVEPGGVLEVFPVDLFDGASTPPRWPTFGVRSVRADDPMTLPPEAQARTIEVPYEDMDPWDPDVVPDQRIRLYQMGRAAAVHFLERWDFEAYVKAYSIPSGP